MGIAFCKQDYRHENVYGDCVNFSYGGYASFGMCINIASDICDCGMDEQGIIGRMFGKNDDVMNFTPRECKIARKFLRRNIECFKVIIGEDNAYMAEGMIHLLEESKNGIRKF